MRQHVLAVVIGVASLAAAPSPVSAQQVSMGWQTACRVDRGSLERKKGVYIFRTSNNNCMGGIFKQRSEIRSRDISVSKRVGYMFESSISLKSRGNNDAIIFQIHDGRNGCSPPLSVRWKGGGSLSFDSDYTRGLGMKGCVENRGLRSAEYSGPSLRRDGTNYQFRVSLSFDGIGGFDVIVFMNDKKSISGKYRPPSDGQFVTSKRFFMKHGVYSQKLFDYEMRSEGMRVFRVAN